MMKQISNRKLRRQKRNRFFGTLLPRPLNFNTDTP